MFLRFETGQIPKWEEDTNFLKFSGHLLFSVAKQMTGQTGPWGQTAAEEPQLGWF